MQEVQEIKDNADAGMENSRGTELSQAFNEGFMQALDQVASDIDHLARLNQHKLTNYLVYLEIKSNVHKALRQNGYRKPTDISKDQSDYQAFIDSVVRGI